MSAGYVRVSDPLADDFDAAAFECERCGNVLVSYHDDGAAMLEDHDRGHDLEPARPMMRADELACSMDDAGTCDGCGFRHWRDQPDNGRACLEVGPWPCNDCGEPVIYSPAFGWYFHTEAPECFLAESSIDYLERLKAAGMRRGPDGFELELGGEE
jgi:hypothetical protein